MTRDKTIEELQSELDELRKRERTSRYPRIPKGWLALLVILVIAGGAVAVILFTHTLTFTPPPAKIATTCGSPTQSITGAIIIFGCVQPSTIGVASGASGTVTYSAFTGIPTQVTDVFLIDNDITNPGPTCAQTTATGSEPVPLNIAGSTLTISSTPGDLHPGHGYNYCMDISALPPAFSATVSWSE